MFSARDRLEALILLSVPLLIVVLGCGASLLRHTAVVAVIDFLTAWMCLALPLAVLVGHCALGGD